MIRGGRSYSAEWARLRRSDEGAALVEFGLVLPMFLLLFAITIEAARTFWSYEATIAGVRDAARYVGRAEASNICGSAVSITRWQSAVENIVRNSSNGTALFPSSITVTSVVPSLTCVSGSYRLTQTPILTVTAHLQITYPFAAVFSMFGIDRPTLQTSVTDRSRIFGA